MGGKASEVRVPGRGVRALFFIVDTTSSGSYVAGHTDQAALTRTGTGDITLTLAVPFSVLFGAHVSTEVAAAAEVIANTVAPTRSVIRVTLNDDAGTAVDGVVHIALFGIDDPY